MTDTSPRPIRLAVCQFAPRLGDVDGNAERIVRTAADVDAELLLFPELALTGYDVRDRVHDLGIEPASLPSHVRLPAGKTTVLGFIEVGEDAVPYNAAALIDGGTVAFVHRKLYLPTYGMFDEGRYFGRGRRVACVDHLGLRIGILICEDFWHPSLCYLLACQHIDVLLVLAAAPGRGAWPGDAQRAFRSTAVWERIVCTTAQLYGIYVALCNRVGVEGGVTFAGGSLVAGPTGEVIGVAPDIAESVLGVVLDRAEIARARRPYAHLRDEEPRLVREELDRILVGHG